ESPRAIYKRGCVKLTLGDWSGWMDRETRHRKPHYCRTRTDYARNMAWTTAACNVTEDLSEKSVLIYSEAGFGDMIQMLRFIPLVAARVRNLYVWVYPQLAELAQHNYGQCATILVEQRSIPSPDRYIWGMALPTFVNELPGFTAIRAPQPTRLP